MYERKICGKKQCCNIMALLILLYTRSSVYLCVHPFIIIPKYYISEALDLFFAITCTL